MSKTRLEAFSDGVIAILITIMVLELKVPHGDTWEALGPLWPTLLSYLLSFIYLGIYWNNHHHLLHAAGGVDGKILWANLHLLFWLSLIPFVTGWMGENHFAAAPAASYGMILVCCGGAYLWLQRVIVKHQGGAGSRLGKVMGADWKGKASLVIYLVAIPIAFWSRAVSMAAYAFVALMWLVPDPRIEKMLRDEHHA